MSTLKRLWRGELPLGEAFWTWAVLGGLLVNLSTSVAFLLLIMQDQPVAAFVIGYACSVPYNVFVTVGVLRSASAYAGDPRNADLARVVTVAGMILLSLT